VGGGQGGVAGGGHQAVEQGRAGGAGVGGGAGVAEGGDGQAEEEGDDGHDDQGFEEGEAVGAFCRAGRWRGAA
jgi:hypothetical protein